MKKKILTLICAIVVGLISTVSCSANRLLPNLKKQNGLTTVYVGKSLIRMAGSGSVRVAPGLVDIEDIVNYLDCVEIVNADTDSSIAYLRPILENAMKSIKGMEMAMEANDDDEEVRIYTVAGSNPGRLSRILIVVSEPDELTVIDMQGDIPAMALDNMHI